MPLPNSSLEDTVQTQRRVYISKLITALCAEPSTVRLGRLLGDLDDRHVQRADDQLCDSCASEWPCSTRMYTDDVAVLYGSDLPPSAWPS